ncbi:MAG: nicotinate-nicotinamide nucleotide adenylyltransferase [Brevinemataceae bacterium]
MNRNIFVYGGSFDPIHYGHLSLIEQILKLDLEIEYFLIVPAGVHPENKKFLFSSQERLLMLKSCVNLLDSDDKRHLDDIGCGKINYILNDSRIILWEDEIYADSYSYTIDTIKNIKDRFPEYHINLLMGADQAKNFRYWKSNKELSELVVLWSVGRGGEKPDELFEWKELLLFDHPASSSEVKTCWKNNTESMFEPEIVKCFKQKKLKTNQI